MVDVLQLVLKPKQIRGYYVNSLASHGIACAISSDTSCVRHHVWCLLGLAISDSAQSTSQSVKAVFGNGVDKPALPWEPHIRCCSKHLEDEIARGIHRQIAMQPQPGQKLQWFTKSLEAALNQLIMIATFNKRVNASPKFSETQR